MSTKLLSELIANAPKREFASLQQRDDYNAVKKALNDEAAENWGEPKWHREQAALLSESLDYGLRNDPVVGSYLPTKTIGKHEKDTVKVTKGMKLFWTARNGQIDQSQLRDEIFEMGRESIGWHVAEFEENILADYAASIEKLRSYALRREVAEINARIFGALQAAVPTTSGNYEDLSGASAFTPTALATLVSEIADVAQPSNADLGAPLSIVGRASSVDKISQFTNFANQALEEIRARGGLGRWNGANIVRLVNWTDDNDASYFPANEFYILGGDLGRVTFYGGTTTREWIENETEKLHFLSKRDIGVTVWRPQFAKRVKVSA